MQHYHQGTFATATTGFLAALAMVWNAAVAHAPSWELVPPILLALASFVTAGVSLRKYLDSRADEQTRLAQRLRQSEEIHRAKMARIAVNGPSFDTLDDRP